MKEDDKMKEKSDHNLITNGEKVKVQERDESRTTKRLYVFITGNCYLITSILQRKSIHIMLQKKKKNELQIVHFSF